MRKYRFTTRTVTAEIADRDGEGVAVGRREAREAAERVEIVCE